MTNHRMNVRLNHEVLSPPDCGGYSHPSKVFANGCLSNTVENLGTHYGRVDCIVSTVNSQPCLQNPKLSEQKCLKYLKA